jgi:glutamine synthetase
MTDTPSDPASPDHPPERPEEVARFLRRHPEMRAVDAIFPDLSGVVRGKRYPIDELDKIFTEGLAFPGSAFLLDVVGESHDPKGLGFSDGDPDFFARAVPGTLKPVPWAPKPLAQVLLGFVENDGRPYRYEPRNVLAQVARQLDALGLTPVVAFELEFYLIDPERAAGEAPQPPVSPLTGQRDTATQVYGMADVDAFDELLEEITRACAAQDVPTGAISAEYAPGQFEINLGHVADPVMAADHCVLFQRAVRGVARRHGLQATFMAKPYPQQAGSGLHMHISMLDRDGNNVFDGGADDAASPTLRHAVGGILDGLPEAMAMLAPNPNSYRRFRPDIFVPIRRSWGFENRSVALRVPAGKGHARRIEHRVAGADANPYLALATALAGAHHGITHEIDPGPPDTGNAGHAYDAALPWRPRRAFESLSDAPILRQYLGADYVDAYAACKLAEMDKFESEPTPIEYRWYLMAD